MHPTLNTLPEGIRAQSVEVLNAHLAATIDLQGQLKQAHWNVRGSGFIALHGLFNEIAAILREDADLLAERAGGLGGSVRGTVQVAGEQSFLQPYPYPGAADPYQHILAIAAVLGAFSQSLHEAVGLAARLGDPVTADILTEILRGIDQQLWLIESHIDVDSNLRELPEIHLPTHAERVVPSHGAVQGGWTRSDSDWPTTRAREGSARHAPDSISRWMNEGGAGGDAD